MSNELEVALQTATPVQINKLFGVSSDKPKPTIPTLKVNEHDDEGAAPKGTFVYEDGEVTLYAKEVHIRSFVKAYQYRRYNATDKTKNDVSIIGMDFKQEFRSTSGKLACGKLSKRDFEKIRDHATTQQTDCQKEVKCKLLVFGLVSGTFTNLDTNEPVKLEDALFVWSVSQTGFMPVVDALKGIEKERRAVPLTPVRVHLKKEKQGTVTYHVPIPEVLSTTAMLDVPRDSAYLSAISKYIKDTNDYVNAKYNAALSGQASNDGFADLSRANGTTGVANDPLDDM